MANPSGPPTAFDSLTVNGVPTMGMAGIPATAGNVFFVDSVTGSNGNTGAANNPLATLAFAASKCIANNGDVVVALPSHAETISAAGGLTVSTAGITFFGIGEGANRPTLTFATSTAATLLITGANTQFLGAWVGTTSIDQIVSPIVIQAAGCTINFEWQDLDATHEALRAILTTAAADNLTINLVYRGFTGGTHGVNAIRLVGCDTGRINIDYYGKASTAVVEFLTTACTNVNVTGYFYNSGTALTKDVVDTATGSTWFASGYDGVGGYAFIGGSGAALAPDTSFAVPSTDSTANVLSRDVVGSKADTALYAPSATGSLAGYAKGTTDLEAKTAFKAAATMVNGQTIFTIAGGPIRILALTSICVTGNDGTTSTLQYSVTPTSGSAQTISGASASLASALAGASVTLAGTALATAALLNANGPNLMANPGTIMAPAGNLTMVIGTGSTTGTWAHYLRYEPLAHGVTVS